jgi:hypothetical protein
MNRITLRVVLFTSATIWSVESTAADTTLNSTLSSSGWLQGALEQVSSARMMADVTELSGPSFRGRQTGTEQDRDSATFVINRFNALRLHRSLAAPADSLTNPLPQREWTQAAPVMTKTIQDEPLLRIGLTQDQPPLRIGTDFLPILDSPSADVRAPIAFVGYGLSDPTQGIDDYAGLDVRDKVVLFLRGKPEKYGGASTHAVKEQIAKEKGAIAYLTAVGPILSRYEIRRGITGRPSAFYSGTDAPHQLPGAWLSTELAEAIVQSGTEGRVQLQTIQEELSRGGVVRSFATDVTAHMRWTTLSSPGMLFNVASAIRGYSPRADETVIVGAHRDHFGQQGGQLFPGADDNASGTAVMLEVARILASAPSAPKRSILFLSFSGEEQGLLGSRLYVSQPIAPLATTKCMVNIDHAGVGDGRLTIGVTGLDKGVATEAGQVAGLADKLDLFGFFPGGDHVPFKEAGVPTITVVSGGNHPHFHQPTDTADTIDPEILQRVARYVLALIWQLANEP